MAPFLIRNSTFSANYSAGSGGAITMPGGAAGSTAQLFNCSIVTNEGTYGGAIRTDWPSGVVEICSCLVAYNVAHTAQSFIRNQYASTVDIISNTLWTGTINQGVLIGSGNITNQNPLVLPLADNGGATWTHALASNSPCIDRGANAMGLAYDQRGAPYNRAVGTAADMGAYEYGAAGPARGGLFVVR
jgi:predicted outer membrane repeat protein